VAQTIPLRVPPSAALRGIRTIGVAAAAVAVFALGTPSLAADHGHPVDAVRSAQWYLRQLDAADALRMSTGAGVIVAVIDSGVDGAHPDLAGQVLPGLDLVNPTKPDRTTSNPPQSDPAQSNPAQSDPAQSNPAQSDPAQSNPAQSNPAQSGPDVPGWQDSVGHGTAIASLIAGRNDATGIVGLAPGAKILPVRVLDASNRYHDPASVAEAVRWSVAHGAKVINLSLGAAAQTPEIAAALDDAFAHDVVVVACAGNRGAGTSTGLWYPARAPGVVSTGGLAPDGTAWSGSLTGPTLALTAPAVDLITARPGGYWQVSGTSFAAALVSATAALVRAHDPTLNAANVVNRLVSTARDLGVPGRDPVYGFGEVDPVEALAADDVPLVDANPLGTPASAAGALDAAFGSSGSDLGLHSGAEPDAADALVSPVRPMPLALLLGGLGSPLLVLAVVLRQWLHRPPSRHARPHTHLYAPGHAPRLTAAIAAGRLSPAARHAAGFRPGPRQAQAPVLTDPVRAWPAWASPEASSAVSAKPVSGSSTAAAKMMPST
jgi:subtilisin family serine protease